MSQLLPCTCDPIPAKPNGYQSWEPYDIEDGSGRWHVLAPKQGASTFIKVLHVSKSAHQLAAESAMVTAHTTRSQVRGDRVRLGGDIATLETALKNGDLTLEQINQLLRLQIQLREKS